MFYKALAGGLFIALAIIGVKMNQQVPSEKTELSYTTTTSGLQYADQVVGSGDTPQTGQRVVVHYTGTLTTGEKFDSSHDRQQPFTFTLGVGQVIKGWDEGLSTMKVGGKRSLVIPANLAYGTRAVGGVIPANATLKFDVELIAIQ